MVSSSQLLSKQQAKLSSHLHHNSSPSVQCHRNYWQLHTSSKPRLGMQHVPIFLRLVKTTICLSQNLIVFVILTVVFVFFASRLASRTQRQPAQHWAGQWWWATIIAGSMIEKAGRVQLLTVSFTGMCISMFAMVAGRSLPQLASSAGTMPLLVLCLCAQLCPWGWALSPGSWCLRSTLSR